jgi:hypothetical protein
MVAGRVRGGAHRNVDVLISFCVMNSRSAGTPSCVF